MEIEKVQGPATASDKVEIGFHDALYKMVCEKCDDYLDWEADFDADGTTYFAFCCSRMYRMSPPLTVSVSWEDDDTDDS